MLRHTHDLNKFNLLIHSLEIWAIVTHNTMVHEYSDTNTESLYRFGWFKINGSRYSISSWKYSENIVTFEEEYNGEKIKYDITKSIFMNKVFKIENHTLTIIEKCRINLSEWLRGVSDKLHP